MLHSRHVALVAGSMKPMAAWLRRSLELQDPRHARMLPMEGLRGVAVILVFLHHYSVQAQVLGLLPGLTAEAAKALRVYGNLGVELFFVLSGYLIYGTLVARRPAFATFMARRIRRIYPTFLVVFALMLALTLALQVPGKIPADAPSAALFFAGNLLLVGGLYPMPLIVTVAWSLSYEMFFYLATSVLVLFLDGGRLQARHRVLAVFGMAAAFVGVAYIGLPDFPARMMPFFAGMLLAEGVGARLPGWSAIAALLAAFAYTQTGAPHPVTSGLLHSMAFFCLCAVCFHGVGAIPRTMSWTPLRWLGNMSYSYYLIHGLVVQAAMTLVGQVARPLPDWMFWAVLPPLFVATLVVSLCLFVAVERPASLTPKS